MPPRHGPVHPVSNIAIGPVTPRRGAQPGDVDSFGENHLEQRALSVGQGGHVLRALRGFDGRRTCQLTSRRLRCLHRRGVALKTTGRFELRWRLVAMHCREALLDLHAATVAMHVPEATDIHEDVEAEALPGA